MMNHEAKNMFENGTDLEYIREYADVEYDPSEDL